MQLPPAIVGKGILASFMGYIRDPLSLAVHNPHVDWGIIGLLIRVGALDSFASHQLAGRLPHSMLRQLFGVSLALMGIYIVWHTLLRVFNQSREYKHG